MSIGPAPMVRLRAPYDFARSIGFWRLSTGELCEQWADGVYRRLMVLDGRLAVVSLHNAGTLEQPAASVLVDDRPASVEEMAALEPLVRHLLGDDADLAAFYAGVAHDPVMAALTRQLYGVRAPRSPLWETLCWVILGQQISLPFAYLLKQRMVERYGKRVDVAGRPLHLFPPPARLAEALPEDLQAMQFSRNKASFVIGLAQALEQGRLDLGQLATLPTKDAVEYLIAFRGVGRWTAEFVLMRALGRRDALPANDAGVRQGITALYGQRLPEPELRVFAERWGEWGGLVATYLLAYLRESRT